MPFGWRDGGGYLPLIFNVRLTTSGVAQDIVTIPVGYVGVSIDITSNGNDYIAFDATATAATGLLVANKTYKETNIQIKARVSFFATVRDTVYGVVWAKRK